MAIDEKLREDALKKLAAGARPYSNESRDMAIELLAWRAQARAPDHIEVNGYRIEPSRNYWADTDPKIWVITPTGVHVLIGPSGQIP